MGIKLRGIVVIELYSYIQLYIVIDVVVVGTSATINVARKV